MPTVGQDATAVIEALEVEIMEKTKKLAELRRNQPREPLPAYNFALGETLDDLFGERGDLLILHNMGKNCSYCTLWADGFIGLHKHILDRCAFAVVSPNDPDIQAAFAESRGWPYRMVSDRELRFTKDMGMYKDGEGVWPGISGFHKNEDGSIVRVAWSYLGPGDDFCAVWHMFELLDGGPGDWEPQFSYGS
ncbi:MAG: peroxiredoxin family protein [Fimbriimonadales bacterium]